MTKHRIDPDRTLSFNVDKIIWGMLEDTIGPQPLDSFTNHRVLWLYHQYCVWYDSLVADHPVAQLSRPDGED
jgi:hypothetical protein